MNDMEEFSLEGFQVVHSEMFVQLPRKSDASCSLFPTKMTFNRTTLRLLHTCEHVRIEVNPSNKCLLVVPVGSSDKDAIRWAKGTKEKYVRNFESRQFSGELYRAWDLNPEYNYRTVGRLVTAKNKLMMLFDFSKAEIWQSKKAEDHG